MKGWCFVIKIDYFVKYNNSYLEQYDELFMIMYVYLHRHKSIEGYVNLTIKDFLFYHNFTPNRNKGRINEKVRNTLQLMLNREFIQYVGCYSNGGLASLEDIDCDMMFTVQLINIDEKWNPEKNFTKILYSEIDILRKNGIKPIDKVLCLYMNIKKNISADAEGKSAIMFTFPSEETLAKKCNCCVSTIKNRIQILCELKMLYMTNYGSYLRMKKGKEIVVNSNNVYALEEKYLNDSTKEAYIKELEAYYGFVDGFFRPCNNLPEKDLLVFDADQWGEPDPIEKDYSIEEILEMPTVSEVQTEGSKTDDTDLIDIDSLYEEDTRLLDLY